MPSQHDGSHDTPLPDPNIPPIPHTGTVSHPYEPPKDGPRHDPAHPKDGGHHHPILDKIREHLPDLHPHPTVSALHANETHAHPEFEVVAAAADAHHDVIDADHDGGHETTDHHNDHGSVAEHTEFAVDHG